MSAPIDTESEAMGDAVADAAQAWRTARVELEHAMLAYRAAGASMATIGAAAGFSAPAVMEILRKHGVR